MSERVEEELRLLRNVYPSLELTGTDWLRIESYGVPGSGWNVEVVEIAFRIPPSVGQAPYGFWVRPGMEGVNGARVGSYTFPARTGFGEGWGQFSWAPESWTPHAEIAQGSSMLSFVRSFADRFRQGP